MDASPTTGGPVTRYTVEYQPMPGVGAPANPVWSVVGEIIVLPHHTVPGLAPATELPIPGARGGECRRHRGDPRKSAPFKLSLTGWSRRALRT